MRLLRESNNPVTRECLEKSINSFISWIENFGYESYDVYDFWSSRAGISAKRLFNSNKFFASPLVGGIQILDSFLPRSRYLFAKKKRFPMSDAQLASAFLNYYHITNNIRFLEKANDLLKQLLVVATKTKHGLGWGNPYDWVTMFFEYSANSPLITVTPYCFDAFLKAYEITHEENYYKTLEQISTFVALDIREIDFKDNTTGSSYGSDDDSLIYNAIAYRSNVLLKAGLLFNNVNYIEKSRRNIDFVIKHQNQDGSWFYAKNSKFIDNFHSCFVLKNIAQAYNYYKEDYMLFSLRNGFSFYLDNFVRPDGTLRHFYRSKYPKFRQIEFYDYAEAIKLGTFLKDIIPEAFSLSMNLSNQLINNFQTREGYFYTRINLLNFKNRIPYLRWPQAQIFNSLTLLLLNLLDSE
jgi:hypothetical protein